MNGHVKSLRLQQPMGPATALLSLLLLMAVDATRTAAAGGNQQCGNSLQRTLKLTHLLKRESGDLIRIYKASQGEMSDVLCTVPVSDIPDSVISGLEPPERIASIYAHLEAFLPHFKRVYEQQSDLQPPASRLLTELTAVRAWSRSLAALVSSFYQGLYPNLPVPEPAGGPTTLPPPQNVFQQKVYGCAVLKTYKEFLSNVSKELRALKGRVCRRRVVVNTLFFF